VSRLSPDEDKVSATMTVNTKTVQGRRRLSFQSIDEVVADAEKLVASPDTKMLGNWPLCQNLTHLAMAINSSIDGISAKAPWFIRLLRPFIKGRILKKGMPAGFYLPKVHEAAFFPPAASNQVAFEQLRSAASRSKNERMTARHPVLGKLTHEEWAQFHLRHAELHLSFAVPG
jgi:hypothetical protein